MDESIDSALENKTIPEFYNKLLSNFIDFFPKESWKDNIFEITYFYDETHYAKIHKDTAKGKLSINFSTTVNKNYNKIKRIIKKDKNNTESEKKFEIYRPDYKIIEMCMNTMRDVFGENITYSQIFIPAGRSFFSTLQNSIFSFLSNNKAIDPFLVKFGSFYEGMKRIVLRENEKKINSKDQEIINTLISDIIGGKYKRIKNEDYITHKDGRLVNLANASSGQQETLPLIIILKAFTFVSFIGDSFSLYIEEPEAHLFPEEQKKMVDLIIAISKLSESRIRIFLTTHSPYILASFNNLLQAGLINSHKYENQDRKIQLFNIGKNELNAYSIDKGVFYDILDKEYGLIDSSYLESISEIISKEFTEYLNLENE